MKKKNAWLYNIAFVVIVGGIVIFLWNAPPETTARVPKDEIHQRFFPMKKKEAEKHCEKCHNPEGDVPLPEGHPPKYRCLFCHKR